MKGQRTGGGSQHHGAIATGILLAVTLLVAGCGTTGGTPTDTAEVDPVAACRAAIADVSRYCAGEEADASRCDNAKTRSADYCLD